MLPAAPWDITGPLPEADEVRPRTTRHFQSIAAKTGCVWPDGSGGSSTAVAGAQRVGSGMVAFDGPNGAVFRVERLGLLASETPGKQTVPRAELWRAVLAARGAQQNA